MLGGLFKKKEHPPAHFLVAQLNARLQPMHRAERFEEGLDDKLLKTKLGEISGGGTMQSQTGEVEYCDIEIKLNLSSPETERLVIDTLEALGAPKGSKLRIAADERVIPFGVNEGLAVYLNGTDLPPETYKKYTLEMLEGELDRVLEDHGHVFSVWRGPTETALYLYGPSFAEMTKLLEPFLGGHPLCERYRLEQIA
ncbi:MAG TPA: hypothetical protein VGP07_10425 [Polyangia bacterium]|jgi:hypothetical protein